jgi:periplasmic divalent cation tolerance protein
VTLSLLLTTVAKKSDARKLAMATLNHRAAACIQIVSGIESHYVWKGKKTTSREFILIAKTSPRQRKPLEKLWKKLHPYDCPELLHLSGQAASSYARWVRASTR